jgi:hypothetical protein
MSMRRRSSLAATLTAIAALTAACTPASQGTDRSAPASTTARAAHSEARSAAVMATESPRVSIPSTGHSTGSSAPEQPIPGLTPAHVPGAARATRDPLTTARVWAIAANSSSYLDPEPGSWTLRSAPLVTGQERVAEQAQRHGGGGATWAQIQAARCVTGLRHLTATMPATVPRGPDRHIVYVAGLTALTCATGQVQLSQFAAQLTVTRVRGHWLVAAVQH